MTVLTTAPLVFLSEDADARLWPLWLQVEHAILRSIRAGKLKQGDRLPGEYQLAKELGVHRHTVRRAMQSLSGRGLLEIRHGRGTFVAPGPVLYRVGGRSRFTGNMEAAGKVPSVRVLRSEIVPATDDLAQNLGLEPGELVASLELLRLADDVPILIARHYVPAGRFPDFAERFGGILSITKTFASYGLVGYRRRWTRLAARQPTPQEAADLNQPSTAPVLLWGSVNADADERPINYDSSVFAAARVSIVIVDGD